MEERQMVWGPTYEEMLDPSVLPEALRQEVVRARGGDWRLPAGLFNITWRDERDWVRAVNLPRELTGVEANILLLIGKYFPSGSHKIGPAYASLMEAEVDGRMAPGRVAVVAPSTGNFGIGVAHAAMVKGYPVRVVMPEGVSPERCERICCYGVELDLTSGTEANLVHLLEYTREHYAGPAYYILGQFELWANYRFHRHVTGGSAIEAAAGFGDGRVAAFVSAPGSAGTLAAGDAIKAQFEDAVVAAVEPAECPYLYRGERGSHHVGGIGDGLVSLIHNVLNTDYVVLVPERDCLRGLRVIQEGPTALSRVLGVPEGAAWSLVDLFGVSTICNILAAIKVAQALQLPAGRNVVTIATDGFDRYPSVLAEFEERTGQPDQATLRLWAADVFRPELEGILDVRPPEQKERLFRQKAWLWTRFGYTEEQLAAMQSPAFWEAQYARVPEYDRRLRALRGF